MAKCVFAGSFDPFTNGHLSIVKMASDIFDEVHIVISVNSNKNRCFEKEKMKDAIKETLEKENLSNCKVSIFDGLIIKYCKENNISYIVRGLRNSMDFEYEANISLINKEICKELNTNVETIYLPTGNAAISSTMIREFIKHKLDIKNYVPEPVKRCLY